MTTPTIQIDIADQSTYEDAAWSYTIPADTFVDADAGDVLTITVTQADGSDLPEWLSYDAATRTLHGTPDNDDVGSLALRAQATDSTGGSVSTEFLVLVINTNDAPTATDPAAGSNASEGTLWTYTLPDHTFTDVDVGDTLTYTATRADGSALPIWLSFNGATLTFSGIPTTNDVGAIPVMVTATDVSGTSASCTFDLVVYGNLVQTSVTTVLGDYWQNLTLLGTAAINGTGNALDNNIVGNKANNVLDGGLGADTMAGGLGNDTYVVDNAGDVVSETSSIGGTDTIYSSVSYALGLYVENLVLTGSTAVSATGNTLANVIYGNSADNLIDGGTGADSMRGGAGNDTYVVDSASDLVVENADEGIDTVQSKLAHTLAANVENLVLTGTSNVGGTGNALANVLTGNSGANALNGMAGADTMIGGLGNDTYYVDDAGDVVVENAGEGTDTVVSTISYVLGGNLENLTLAGSDAINGTGNALNNILSGNGNSAANVLTGGAGNDTYVVDVGDTVVELAGEGTDTVQAYVSFTLGANLENLTLLGSAAISGTGNSLANVITSDANTAANTLAGGAGNDTYVIGDGDVVVEAAGEGTDLVKAAFSYALTANVENLTLTGTAAVNGTGNTLANVLTGNAADNVLDGGAGADTMSGGLGNDSYFVDNTGDVVTEAAGGGTDTVNSSITYTLGANVENITLTGWSAINATGNGLDNVLVGNSAANVLTGGAGNDTYYVGAGDTVVELAGGGIDTVISSVTRTIAANVENLTLTGTAMINGTGNSLDNVLTGNAGSNTLDGGAGADTMAGGLSSDVYIVDDVGDVVIEYAGGGGDEVDSYVSYVLGDQLESLRLLGSAGINGTGNALSNVIVGNSGANVMTGGLGDDTYVVSAGDTVVEYADEGQDLVFSDVTWVLGQYVEDLVLIGDHAIDGVGNALANRLDGSGNSAANVLIGGGGDDFYVLSNADSIVELADEGTDMMVVNFSVHMFDNVEMLFIYGDDNVNITGNDVDNTIYGNSGNNRLEGGIGADYMAGSTGNDVYIVDSGDYIVEYGDEGYDEVDSSVDWALGANFEKLVLTGAASINAVGNELDNLIYGNGGNNVIEGGAGADTLIGGAGNDTYVVGRDGGADRIQESSGGTDVVQFTNDVSSRQLWFRHSGTFDLEVSIIGTNDKVTIANWYLGSQYHAEEFHLADGKVLLDGAVGTLVTAMALLTPPALGQLELPETLQAILNGVIDAAWH